MAKTLSEKVWDRHVVHSAPGEPDLLYIDLHLVHEVTSPQAFDGIRLSGRRVRRPDLTVATADHNVPTEDIDKPVADPSSLKGAKNYVTAALSDIKAGRAVATPVSKPYGCSVKYAE